MKALLIQARDWIAGRGEIVFAGCGMAAVDKMNALHAALQAAIEAPEPEPVAWRLGINLHHSLKDAEWEWRHGETYSNTSYAPEPLYLHPPAAHQPLTLAQVDDLLKNWYPVADYLEHIELVRAIKAAVRAKQ